MGVHLDDTALSIIDGHMRLLSAWNTVINLTAIEDPEAAAQRHVADSLAAVPVIREGRHAALLDLGSGAGFPGLPLAAALSATHVTLVESIGKKAAFLRTVVDATDLGERVKVRYGRAEAATPGRWDVVTARAVGSLPDLVEVGLPLLAPGGRLIAWKRGDLRVELAAGTRATRALAGADPRWRPHPEVVARSAALSGHGVVVIRKSGVTPPGYPRDPGSRKRRPW